MLTDATQLLDTMGWRTLKSSKKKSRELFITLTPNEKIITHLLQAKEQMSIDEINLVSGLSSSAIAAAILNLEMQQVIATLPGKQYRLL